ncbi:MAG: DNA polymerase III subunit beta [Coxiella sp. RIFCSPHIGHO2_12_FULL_44_14]|nr:MAG: DNA polymerase III subunit beta [Coxiella sp. RIFCSPHIGHO2_12_FULL_44_14]
MKINLQRETLLKPLQMVIGVVERKQSMPILANVLLSIKENKLSITGTDTEVELIGYTDFISEVNPPLDFTLPGRKLMDICRALPENAPIELYQDKAKIVLRSGRSRFTLSTLPVEEFPNGESQTGYLAFTIPQFQLKQLLQRTYFAMAQQDVRYYLNGLLFEILQNQLRTIATDGHRLAFNACNITVDASQKIQVIIPRKAILELLRLLEDIEQEVGVTLSNGHIHIASEHFMFTSKLVEGRFPDYERVIPRNGNKTIFIEREPLKQSLSRSAILCNEKYKGIRFEIANHLLKITTNNPEQESAEEEIMVDYLKEPLDIGFNVSYLLDVLNTIKSDTVKFTFSDSNKSTLIEETGQYISSLFVIMPMCY